MVLSPWRAARSIVPAVEASNGESTMMRYRRPFSQIEVVPAVGATMSFRCFSVTSATASVMGEP
jgi:hypothetical protein